MIKMQLSCHSQQPSKEIGTCTVCRNFLMKNLKDDWIEKHLPVLRFYKRSDNLSQKIVFGGNFCWHNFDSFGYKSRYRSFF